MATTNETGLLSEYGEFLPTQPGLNLLRTKPDLTQTNNLQGQCPLHVIALATDVNRDGVIDSSFGGPDFTSLWQPFRFWVNDCNDMGDDYGSGIPGQGEIGLFLSQAAGQITGTRALVNFFPVQVCVRSVLQAVPSLSTLTFKLKQADNALYYVETELTADHCRDYLTSTNFLASLPSYVGSAGAIGDWGTALSTNFLAKIRDEGKGVILVEAGKATTQALVLEVWQGTNLLASTGLYLSISPVEQMFRHKNLIRESFPSVTSAEAPADRLTENDVPNEPDTNDKNFVFLHGYNVNPNEARGNAADVFKRLYWSGSHAKFYGVTWRGSESQVNLMVLPPTSPNYHTNVANAFLTAPKLRDFLATLTNGPTTVAAHSLGNMVALDALSEYEARMDQLFMIDAAVAMEAIDSSLGTAPNMIHPEWMDSGYANRLYASAWYNLFPPGDGRNGLGWAGRLANLGNVDVYNFYSSGEEVLREHTGAVPSLGGLLLDTAARSIFGGAPASAFVWALQEKEKGRTLFDAVLGSSHGGWGFNNDDPNYTWFITGGDGGQERVRLDAASAAALPTEQLQTNAFFDMHYDTALFTIASSGSTYAQANRNRILADAIPALTLPVGANAVTNLDVRAAAQRNFDMQALYESGWPSGRPLRQVGATAPGEWWHSDFHRAAYTFTYKLYSTLVTDGNLK
jgi:pimeloyl-ACP methyl ester carboxylesterase